MLPNAHTLWDFVSDCHFTVPGLHSGHCITSHTALHWIVQCLKSPMFLMTLTVLRCIGQLSSQSVPLIRIHLIRIYGFLGKDQKCKGLFSSYPQGYLLSTYLKLLHVCAWLSGFSTVWLFATLWTVARQAPLSKGFSR